MIVNGWTFLAFAAVGEVAFAALLPATQGLSRLWSTSAVIAVGWATTWALSKAMQVLNPAISYSVWVGCGIVGVVMTSTLLHKQPVGGVQLACISLILVGVIGLKLLGTTEIG